MNKYTANVLFKLNFSCHCKKHFFLLLMKTKEKHNLETAVEESEVSNVAYASLLFSSVKERKCFHSGNYSNK